MATITHTFESQIADDPAAAAAGAVLPSHWNADHTITGLTAADVANVPAGTVAGATVQAAINELDTEKQAALVSGTNIKTINGSTLLGSGDLVVGALGYAAEATISTPTATGAAAVAIGNGAQAVTGANAMALGRSYSSGADALAGGIGNVTSTYGAQGANSVAFGLLAKATGQRAVAISTSAAGCTANSLAAIAIGTGTASAARATSIGNEFNWTSPVASGVASTAIGDGATASGTNALAFGYGLASGDNSLILGSGAKAAQNGKMAFASSIFALRGDAQNSVLVPRAATTDATVTRLTTDGAGASATNQLVLENNSAVSFTGLVIARQKASEGTASASWKVEGHIRREASAGTTTLVASTVTAISNAPGWTLALSADTTNGAIAATIAGAAATNVRTVLALNAAEVVYA